MDYLVPCRLQQAVHHCLPKALIHRVRKGLRIDAVDLFIVKFPQKSIQFLCCLMRVTPATRIFDTRSLILRKLFERSDLRRCAVLLPHALPPAH